MVKKNLRHIVLLLFGFIMIYPLIWLFFCSFKTNTEIFSSISLLPRHFNIEGYVQGWKGQKQIGFDTYMLNSLFLVVPTVAFTALSAPLVAYGFGRFSFPGHKILFGLMLSTLMLPNTVLVVPRYLIFRNLGWLDTYLPFWIPALLATAPFYTFMIYQFVRGIPKVLDESAMIDGLGPIGIYFRILLPLIKPAVISSSVLVFIWSWNDFFNALIYIPTVNKFPVSLGLRMMMDAEAANAWNQIIAMSIVSMLPCALFFFICQRYLVEGIATSGLKG